MNAPSDLVTLSSLPPPGDPRPRCAYVCVRRVQESKTRQGLPYVDLQLSDAERTVTAKVWSDAVSALRAARGLQRGQAVLVRFAVEEYQGAAQLNVSGIWPAKDDSQGYEPGLVYGPGHGLAAGLSCRTLVFDIETVPLQPLAALPPGVAASVERHAAREGMDADMAMSLSPMLGKVVSLAFVDGEEEGAEPCAFIVPQDGAAPTPPNPGITVVCERDLLQVFWHLASWAEVVVTYNGRGFDVPFLVGRSLALGVPARVDLLGNPYSLRPHLDLMRLLGAGRPGPASLEAVCYGLGIESPKVSMSGAEVAPAYERGELERIAEYNRHDVRATAELYRKVRDGVLRFRGDW